MSLTAALLGLSGLAFNASDATIADPGPVTDADTLAMLEVDSQQQRQQRQQRPRRQQSQRRPQSNNDSQSSGDPFGYTHISAWTGTESIDDSDREGDALRLNGAIHSGQHNYLFLDWQEGEYDDVAERRTREFGLGIAEQYSANTSFFFTLSYLQDEWDNPPADLGALTDGRDDESEFLRGRYGMRGRLTDRIEIDAAVVYTRASGSTEMDSRWSMDLGLSIYVTENIALRAVGTDLDGIRPSRMFGIRVEFD